MLGADWSVEDIELVRNVVEGDVGGLHGELAGGGERIEISSDWINRNSPGFSKSGRYSAKGVSRNSCVPAARSPRTPPAGVGHGPSTASQTASAAPKIQ